MAKTNVNALRQANHFQIPVDIEDDFFIENNALFSVVVNEESVNYIIDPEVTDLSNYNTGTAFAVFYFDDVWVGSNSLLGTFLANQYIYVPTNFALSDNLYTFSFYVKGAGQFDLAGVDGANIIVTPTIRFTATGKWQRVTFTFRGTGVVNLRIQAPEVSEAIFDGFQLEEKTYATTFISGSLNFPQFETNRQGYYWLGEPNNSFSVRDGRTNSGGRVFSFKELGLDILGFEGLGLPTYTHQILDIAYSRQSYYQTSKDNIREFTLLGQITDSRLFNTLKKRFNLTSAVNPDRSSFQQPIRLIFQMFDQDTFCEYNENGLPLTEQFFIDAIYNGGLEGTYTAVNGERLAINFIAPDRNIYSYPTSAVKIDTIDEINLLAPIPQPAVLSYGKDGEWQHLNFQAVFDDSGDINDGIIASNNNLFLGGVLLTTVPNYILMNEFDGNNWQAAITTGTNGERISSIVEDGQRNIYVGGRFTTAQGSSGGDVLTGHIGKFDIITKQTTSIGTVNSTAAAAYSPVEKVIFISRTQNGTGRDIIIIGGQFSSITQTDTTVVNAKNVAAYFPDTDTWSNLSNLGLNIFGPDPDPTVTFVKTLLYDSTGILWIGGRFNGSTNSNQYNLTTTYRNIIRVNFESLTIIPTDQLVRGGTGFNSSLSSGANPPLSSYATVYDIIETQNGDIYAAGDFDSSGKEETWSRFWGFYIPSVNGRTINIARWRGSYWVGINDNIAVERFYDGAGNIILSNLGTIFRLTEAPNGWIYVAGSFDYFGSRWFAGYDPLALPWIGVYDWANYPVNASQFGVFKVDNLITAYPISFIVGNNTFNIGKVVIPGGKYGDNNFQTAFNNVPGLSLLNVPPGYDGSIFYAGTFRGTIATSQPATIELNCTSIIKPIINTTGPCVIHSIENASIDKEIVFSNGLTLELNEVLTVDLSQLTPKIFTNIKGDVSGTISSGSNLNTFVLAPGENIIRVRYLDIPSITGPEPEPVTRVFYRKAYNTIDGVVETCFDF